MTKGFFDYERSNEGVSRHNDAADREDAVHERV